MDEKSSFPRNPQVTFGRAIAIGMGAGAVGAIGMLISSKIEQVFTHRPNSYVPGHSIGNLLGLSRDRYPDILNHVHHFGMAILTGPIRSVMSYYGVIGPFASFVFTGVRVLVDQTVENVAGTSAMPWTWPINEQVIDLGHKAVFAVIVGYITDKMVRGVDWFNH